MTCAVLTRGWQLFDVLIAFVALVASLLLPVHGGDGTFPPGHALDLVTITITACTTLPLVGWRRAPYAVFVFTATTTALGAGFGYPLGVPLGPTIALYLLAASRDDTSPWTRWLTTTMVGIFAGYLLMTALDEGAFPESAFVHTGLAWAVAWFAGERTRLRREHIVELEERAMRAEREAARDQRLAVVEERARIARDVHDSAGHAISVIALRAGTARLRHDEDPERSRAALVAIEDVARRTVADIDEIVGTLRADRPRDGGVEAPPGLASLDTLVEQHTAAGLDVTLAVAGTPRPLGGPLDQTTYRILQEALTNAARHGTGTARIDLRFGESGLGLEVANHVADSADRPTSGGRGLIGMYERARLLGGDLSAAGMNGDFQLRAQLPYPGHGT